MNKTEKEYYKKCTTPVKARDHYHIISPICVYYDTCKQRCELNFCYRELKEKGAKAWVKNEVIIITAKTFALSIMHLKILTEGREGIVKGLDAQTDFAKRQ